MRSISIIFFFLFLFTGLEIFAQETKLVVEKDKVKGSKGREEYHVLASNNAVKHGKYKKYSYSGRLNLEGYFKGGKKDSIWTEYAYSGKILSSGSFNNGLRTGAWTYYDQEGKLLRSGAYVNDVKSGLWEYYNSDGRIEQRYNHSTKKLEYFSKPDTDKTLEILVIQNKDTVPVQAEQPALFIGGDWMQSELLNDQINYPEYALENDIQGTVYITFIVDENGKARNHVAVTKLGYGLEEESLRVMKILTNEWIPAMKDGKPIESVVKMPVKFVLQ